VKILLLFLAATANASFDPIEYQAPNPPQMTGALAPNTELVNTRLLGKDQIHGPEGLAIDKNGFLYAGTHDGSVLKIDPRTEAAVKIGNTGGRALGLALHNDGRIIIADMSRGLLAMDMNGNTQTLANGFGILDDVEVATDGKIYFSEATHKYNVDNFQLDVLENRPNGRLLVYDPSSRQTTTLIPELYFANGVALSKNEDFILVAESSRYRITRYWLKGEKKGTQDVFADNLPGFPDNLSRSEDGQFWIAMVSPRNALVDFLHRYPKLKKLIAKLPKSVWAKQKKYGLVLKMNETGNIEKSFHDAKAVVVSAITAVEQFGDILFFGTYENNWIGQLNIRK
jgi:sugar lactone lactonase YvrE